MFRKFKFFNDRYNLKLKLWYLLSKDNKYRKYYEIIS